MEDQLVTTFNYAAAEMRSLRDHEWTITYYTVLAYVALAAVPYAVKRWHSLFCALAIFLVLLVASQALRTLWFTGDLHDVASDRLRQAVQSLPAVCYIHQKHPPTHRSKRPWWVRLPSLWSADPPDLCCETPVRSPEWVSRHPAVLPEDFTPTEDRGLGAASAPEASQAAGSDLPLRPGLVAVVIFGAAFAGLILFSHIRCFPATVLVVAVGYVMALLVLHEVF